MHDNNEQRWTMSWHSRVWLAALSALSSSLLAGCGGGGTDAPPPAHGSTASVTLPHQPSQPRRTSLALAADAAGVPNDTRAIAATATANSTTNACAPIRPFYWEIGDVDGRIVGGSVGGDTYGPETPVEIASASKWLYAAYVLQRQNGVLSPSDVQFLTFRSGFTNFSSCLQGQTVSSCLDFDGNGDFVPTTAGYFYYDGGHMQKHAELIGLGNADDDTLPLIIGSQLTGASALSYWQPQLAGGAVMTPDDYAAFLRAVLAGSLQMSHALDIDKVCTNPVTCPAQALSTPVPTNETWHYSIGHWIEDDPQVGDGAFSSAGAFGFYPWIDAGRTYYGILSREDRSGTGIGFDSVQCGRLVRRAWESGVAQSG
jgi:hypothetical protein